MPSSGGKKRLKFSKLLQSVSDGITKCVSFFVLQNASGVITKCVSFLYYKVRQFLLQSASGITKCVKVYYKVRQVLQSVAFITKCLSTRESVGKN